MERVSRVEELEGGESSMAFLYMWNTLVSSNFSVRGSSGATARAFKVLFTCVSEATVPLRIHLLRESLLRFLRTRAALGLTSDLRQRPLHRLPVEGCLPSDALPNAYL